MTEENKSFKVGIDFDSVLRAISKQIYETPLAFIRENVQNAVDAMRIQAFRDQLDPADERYKIEVAVEDGKVTVRDNGIGMSAELTLQMPSAVWMAIERTAWRPKIDYPPIASFASPSRR